LIQRELEKDSVHHKLLSTRDAADVNGLDGALLVGKILLVDDGANSRLHSRAKVAPELDCSLHVRSTTGKKRRILAYEFAVLVPLVADDWTAEAPTYAGNDCSMTTLRTVHLVVANEYH
jgi:hypothetical protein